MLEGALKALFCDESFMLDTVQAKTAHCIAQQLLGWTTSHKEFCVEFQGKMVGIMGGCIIVHKKDETAKSNRKRMWTAYHSLRVGKTYIGEWENLLEKLAFQAQISM